MGEPVYSVDTPDFISSFTVPLCSKPEVEQVSVMVAPLTL